ncbi:DoxX family protein [Rhodococcus sp. TAF43]|uniref:DoxX family protein n=1 Tax=unclassified Rhodococcus (in: high G+C Gram-positive bacteria) TaxID=192944 RepID=UPI000E0C4D5D|nr:DoxX family protein [Rhodococcus sp. AG1013]RDI21171.1 putative membrane protein YphA (DoxX/SURF4 family) [Rhodococcus sp. AG1013]
MIVRRIARPLLSTVFIAGGIDSLRSPAPKAQAAGPFLEKSVETLPAAVTQRVPSDPETLVKINAAVQIGAGAMLALGKAPRASSLVLAGTLVPTTLAGHDFWNVDDPQQRAMQRMQFFKNMTMLGGLLIAAVDTEGKPSLGWRGRRAARKAQAKVADAVSTNGDDHALAVVSDRARTAAEQAGERSGELLDAARQRGAVLAHLAKERGTELTEVARERGPVLAELAKERGTELAQLARERGTEWAATASEQGEVLSRRARKQAERALATARAKAAELQD